MRQPGPIEARALLHVNINNECLLKVARRRPPLWLWMLLCCCCCCGGGVVRASCGPRRCGQRARPVACCGRHCCPRASGACLSEKCSKVSCLWLAAAFLVAWLAGWLVFWLVGSISAAPVGQGGCVCTTSGRLSGVGAIGASKRACARESNILSASGADAGAAASRMRLGCISAAAAKMPAQMLPLPLLLANRQTGCGCRWGCRCRRLCRGSATKHQQASARARHNQARQMPKIAICDADASKTTTTTPSAMLPAVVVVADSGSDPVASARAKMRAPRFEQQAVRGRVMPPVANGGRPSPSEGEWAPPRPPRRQRSGQSGDQPAREAVWLLF